MSHQIFINLPVTELEKATAFYKAIGFTQNMQFSNEDASGMAFDDNIHVMLLTHKFAKTFLPHKEIANSKKTCEVLNAISFDSKEAVNSFVDTAVAAGANEFRPAYDHGFMYGRDFEDLDGHIREIFWMDQSTVQ
jgi:predicted lactoylglutathione lyase